ncbi:MAG: DUF2169 domain-containing protein [Deltaproteobacteria bacterium]|nr:DUF2169 domain-containing protein [Deltaproteobacteria bacterium]
MSVIQIFRPLQVGFNSQVLEQNRKFYFIASATLGVNLQTGEELLDVNYLKDVFEGMGENLLPDMGMPKPNGEFLVSGNFFAPGNKAVTGGEVKVRLDEIEKELFVFGPRKFKAGFPSTPEEILSMPVDFTKAFGGQEFEKNPDGIGFNDGLLPCIEDPSHLVASKGDKPEPVGFSPLYLMLPQRMKYQGTYDSDYKNNYFPGYPADHDWRYFLCAPSDQWIKNFYKGDESFSIHNMHPELPVIEGRLPGLYARCFINQKKKTGESVFSELPLNLDTIWFFPEKLLSLLIFRGVIAVEDDEAETITHVLLGYEDKSQQPRDFEYYKHAFEKRENSDDALLNNLNTQDLIPEGHKCAMELLMEMGASDAKAAESPLAENINAKAKATQEMTDEKIEEAVLQVEKNMGDVDIPGDGKVDIRKMMKEQKDVEPDPDLEAMNQKLELIFPGITSDNPKTIDMKNFSFDKIDEVVKAVDEFAGKKEKQAKDLTIKEIEKVKEQIKKQIENIDKQIEEAKKTLGSKGSDQVKSLEDIKKRINENFKALNDIDLDGKSKTKAPLPRVDMEKIKAQTAKVNPQVMEAMQHIQSMKAMGIEDETTMDLENQVRKIMETSTKQLEQGLQEAQKAFKEGYILGAHFMEKGLSPHKDPLKDVKKCFLEAVSKGEDVSQGDWACIDLAGVNLDGIDLSGAFLEQVNFKGASLKNADLSKTILARADLEDADFTGANLEKANVGAVHALRADFTDANLKSAKLSKGDFTKANFTKANLEDIESLEVVIVQANFTQAYMPKINFVETKILEAKFVNADMNTSAFIKCSIEESDFSEAVMNGCAFIESQLKNICFEKADLSNACFVVVEPEKSSMENFKFRGACLKQVNFQNMNMQKSDLTYTNMENAFFGGTDLSGADLSHADAKNAQFRKAKLNRAKLNKINLDQGSLAKANLVGASFTGANLHAVDFLRSTITDTDFKGCNLDATLIEHWRPE